MGPFKMTPSQLTYHLLSVSTPILKLEGERLPGNIKLRKADAGSSQFQKNDCILVDHVSLFEPDNKCGGSDTRAWLTIWPIKT